MLDHHKDWEWFYVNIFVDRDMFMRYRSGAIGHMSTSKETNCLLDDRDELDKAPFELESEEWWECDSGVNADSDVEMNSRGTDESETEDDVSVDEEQSEKEGSDDDEPEDDENNDFDTGTEPLVNEELLDEMDDFGYSGLDEVEEDGESEVGDDGLADDAFGAEDGENVEWNEDEDELAHAYL